jgi:hypothetical protein
MKIIKLTNKHVNSVKKLFYKSSHMGIKDFGDEAKYKKFCDKAYQMFCDNYLSDLDNFQAFGAIQGNKVHALISFYESVEEPSWYFTIYRSNGSNFLLKDILDKVIEYNESNGRLKFYTLVNSDHSRLLRRFTWSKYNDERYGYFDEYIVPERCKTFYFNHWEILYKRTLIPIETTVRCNFLKQEYRTDLPIGGGL